MQFIHPGKMQKLAKQTNHCSWSLHLKNSEVYVYKYIHAPLWRYRITPTTLRRLKLDARDKERNSKHTREMPLYVCSKPVEKKKKDT